VPLSGWVPAASLLSLVLILTSIGGWGTRISADTTTSESEVRASRLLDTSSIDSVMAVQAAADSGDYGMYFKLVETGEEAGYQADRAFNAASCYKVALVMYIYESAAAGRIDLESTIVYGGGDYTNGCGIIQEMPVGTTFTVRTLCEYAIVYSDNIAAKMLKRVFGYHAFRDHARSLGCPVTGTYGLNLTTAREMGIILQRVLQFAAGEPLGQEVLTFLRASIYKSRIPAGLPAGVDVGNKTGDYGGSLNDAAIVMLDDATYILCILSSGAPGDSVHATVSRLVCEDVSSRICGGGHCTTGASEPATEWYFAEGTTREGFETWLCLANPGEEAARVTVTTMDQYGDAREFPLTLPPDYRESLLLNELVGGDLDIAMCVSSTVPILAERPMYFRYKGTWAGGHCTTGASEPATEWYFAEGTTREGFETWLCLANPGEEAARVSVDYLLSGAEKVVRTYNISPHCRLSIPLSDELGTDLDVSASIHSSRPILAERPLYFRYSAGGGGGHCVSGIASASRVWYFAEGCTREGFDTWLCIGNPAVEAAMVYITFLDEAGSTLQRDFAVPPASRLSLKVDDLVEEGHDIATVITSNLDIVVERPLYFLFSPQSL